MDMTSGWTELPLHLNTRHGAVWIIATPKEEDREQASRLGLAQNRPRTRDEGWALISKVDL